MFLDYGELLSTNILSVCLQGGASRQKFLLSPDYNNEYVSFRFLHVPNICNEIVQTCQRIHVYNTWSQCCCPLGLLGELCVSSIFNHLKFLYRPKQYIDTNADIFPWGLGGAVYIFGALLFVFRIPERYFPKTYDNFGASHQLFHLCVVGGCAIHFNAAM